MIWQRTLWCIIFCTILNCGCVPTRKVNVAKTFSASEWKKSNGFERGRMLPDLLGYESVEAIRIGYLNNPFEGMTRREVIQVLDEPDINLVQGGYQDGFRYSATIVYFVGDLGRRIDYRSDFAIAIYFDKEGHAIRLELE